VSAIKRFDLKKCVMVNCVVPVPADNPLAYNLVLVLLHLVRKRRRCLGGHNLTTYLPLCISLACQEASTSSTAGLLRPPRGRNQPETTIPEDFLRGRTRSVSRSWASIAASSRQLVVRGCSRRSAGQHGSCHEHAGCCTNGHYDLVGGRSQGGLETF